jgi:hypothetical protein
VDEDRQSREAGAGDALRTSSRVQSGRSALPHRLRRRLEASADDWLRQSQRNESFAPVIPVTPRVVADRATARRALLAAAACLLLAVAGWWPRLQSLAHDAAHGVSPLLTTAEKGREHLLQSADDHLGRWSWTHEPGVAVDVQGEVVWDGSKQEGYLTLSGLPVNEHSLQYQLWIFDAERDERYPVDGGVFDVPAGQPTLTVPIRPALRVHQPVAFAVTLEPAGGVVVSDRSRLMALARAGTP